MAAMALPFPTDDADRPAAVSGSARSRGGDLLARLLEAGAVLKELAGLDWTQEVGRDRERGGARNWQQPNLQDPPPESQGPPPF